MKKSVWALLALLLCLPSLALGQAYSFPYAGVSVQAQDDWVLLTPDTLDEHADWLQSMGTDAQTVRADYAAGNVAWEVYLPDGAQVALSVAQTAQTEAWDSMARMTEANRAELFAQYNHAPYEHLEWPQALPGYLRCDWTLRTGGANVTFARLMTVRQGALYALTATGVGLDAQALHAACETVLGALEYLGARAGAGVSQAVTLPEPIADDGAVTPLSLREFAGVSYEDSLTLVIDTLPGADLTLQTASDTLRGTADETGQHTFKVSTRRESVYRYTLTAKASGRAESRMEIAVERRLTGEALADAYRKRAQAVSALGYANLAQHPQDYAGQPVALRGRVAAFGQSGGFPCALVYTSNPGSGVWREPVWVLLMEPVALELESVLSFYGDVRGDAMAYAPQTAEEGENPSAPVVVCRYAGE